MISAKEAQQLLVSNRNKARFEQEAASVDKDIAEILRHASIGLYSAYIRTSAPTLLRKCGFLVDFNRHRVSWALPNLDAPCGDEAKKMREIADGVTDNGKEFDSWVERDIAKGEDCCVIPLDQANPAALLTAGYPIDPSGNSLVVYWTRNAHIWHKNYLLDKKARHFGFFRRLFYKAMFYNYLEYTK